ncbi:hypothetical protein B484DRAFT_411709, partial [Ochromonadaceae sp. CCMP2298]
MPWLKDTGGRFQPGRNRQTGSSAEQYTLAQLVQSDEWRAQVSDPATALQKFAILFNNSQKINWPKTANYVRFFPGCWGGVVKGAAALSDDELRTLIS